MAVVELVMPKLGESIMEATILKWLKKPGDTVRMDEPVLEIATDKVDSEVPSTAEGTVQEILFNENDVVSIGTVIARINTSAEATVSGTAAAQSSKPEPQTPEQSYRPTIHEENEEEETTQAHGNLASENQQYKPTSTPNRFYSPLVLNIAASEGVGMQELESIPGTGNEGRVTKKDILQYVANRKQPSQQAQSPARATVHQESGQQVMIPESRQPSTSTGVQQYGSNVEIIELDRMRKMIAKHMVESKHTSAHVTSFSEADVTNMVLWRNRIKKEFEKRENEKITFTPLFIEAIIRCIKKYPWLNSSVEGDKLIVKKDINIGMATALPSGNLIVPVIRNADQLNLVGLTKQVNGLANAARNNKLKPDDTSGGTFTMTNVGSFGSIMGTPIINQPQVAILAVGAIKKKPVVIETEQGDSIAIRHMMYLSMSYDHRIIDGALGATFLNAVARELENFDPAREI